MYYAAIQFMNKKDYIVPAWQTSDTETPIYINILLSYLIDLWWHTAPRLHILSSGREYYITKQIIRYVLLTRV